VSSSPNSLAGLAVLTDPKAEAVTRKILRLRALANAIAPSTLAACSRKSCGAKPGEPCREGTGAERYPHIGRLRASGLVRKKRRRKAKAKA
jgi:hypothetical protein